MKKNGYTSDIVLGEKYRDEQSGYEGTATAIYFFQYGCERVQIETYDGVQRQIRTETFDAPRLTHIESGKRAKTDKTGGPGDPTEGNRAGIDMREVAAR